MRVVVAGGTGFVGGRLVRRLVDDGHEVIVLSRSPERARLGLPVRASARRWSPPDALGSAALGGADVVVNLAGAGIADRRWTAARKQLILDSRVQATRTLVSAMGALPAGERPAALVSASAVGWYGDRGGEVLTEASAPGSGFLADVCRAWEAEAERATSLGVRTVMPRIGVVLGSQGGALARMLPPFRLGLGGRLGSGEQWMSWIHLDDLVSLIVWAATTSAVRGPVNAVAPEPVPNAVFTRALGGALGRPTIVPAPAFAIRLALGEMAAVLLDGQRAEPEVAARAGFRFAHPRLAGALADVCRDLATEVVYEQWVPSPPEAVFAFFADPHNLEQITPPWLRFKVLGASTPTVERGTRIDYRLRLRGIPIRWRSLIETYEPPRRFVDTQTKGPYALWHHTHEFEPYRGGTLLRDRVRYRLPMAPLGALVAGRRVARDVEAIFAHRRATLAERFGSADAPA